MSRTKMPVFLTLDHDIMIHALFYWRTWIPDRACKKNCKKHLYSVGNAIMRAQRHALSRLHTACISLRLEFGYSIVVK
jgi:hypothetical protein